MIGEVSLEEQEKLKRAFDRDGCGECWICGHQTYERNEKLHGYQEDLSGELQLICSTCVQVQLIANKESLHGKDCNGSPFVRMFIVGTSPNKPRKAIGYRVLDRQPWIEKYGELVK